MTAPEPNLIPIPACWVCDGTDLAEDNEEYFDMTWQDDPVLRSYHGQRFRLRRCRRCGFRQPGGLPAEPDFFDRLYGKDRGGDWMETDFAHPYKDGIFRAVLGTLARLLPADRRSLLDIGTHVGKMPFLARQLGWQPEGIELNPAVAAFAERRTGLPIWRLSAEQLARTTARRYDALTLTDVLEHIPRPVDLLADLRPLLAPGGWIAVKVPCGGNQLRKEQVRRWLGRVPDVSVATNLVHVNHFSPHSLRLALERAGFADVRVTVGRPELDAFRWSPGAVASRLFRLGVYHLARLPGGLRTPLALNLQAYARRAEEPA